MELERIKEEVSKMELSEKLLLVEDIWDSIATGNSELPISMWHKRELDKRYKEYKKGQLELHDWEKIHEDLRKKYK